MLRALFRRSAWLLGLLALVLGPLRADAQPHARTLDGREIDLFDRAVPARATVLLFTATDCPISNRYAPEVTRLRERFAPSGVRFVLVYANPSDQPDAIRTHLARFGYTMDAVRDPEHELVTFAHATVSPEAAVFDRTGREVYRGRIDDRFANVGVDRQTPTRRDLEDALGAVLDGRPVPTPVTKAVGCFLADFRR